MPFMPQGLFSGETINFCSLGTFVVMDGQETETLEVQATDYLWWTDRGQGKDLLIRSLPLLTRSLSSIRSLSFLIRSLSFLLSPRPYEISVECYVFLMILRNRIWSVILAFTLKWRFLTRRPAEKSALNSSPSPKRNLSNATTAPRPSHKDQTWRGSKWTKSYAREKKRFVIGERPWVTFMTTRQHPHLFVNLSCLLRLCRLY